MVYCKITYGTIAEIESLIRKGSFKKAKRELDTLLREKPSSVAARLMSGLCELMKGNAEDFCRIYNELAPEMSPRAAADEDSPEVSLWCRYVKAAAYLVVLLGTVVFCGYKLLVCHDERPNPPDDIRYAVTVLDEPVPVLLYGPAPDPDPYEPDPVPLYRPAPNLGADGVRTNFMPNVRSKPYKDPEPNGKDNTHTNELPRSEFPSLPTVEVEVDI